MSINQHLTILDDARDACGQRDWIRAYDAFIAAQHHSALQLDDLRCFANAAWWLGRVDESIAALEESYRRYVQEGQPRAAANAALLIAYTVHLRGENALTSAWMSRMARLLESEPFCAEQGYLKYYEFESALLACDNDTALERARDVREIGVTFSDPTLVALGVLAEGRALVREGSVRRGMELLDEAMLSAVTDNLHPGWGGNIYCHLMSTCQELADIRRAAEWTGAIAHWWSRFPATGPFLGICRAHRAEVFQLQGAWDQAEHEANLVCTRMTHFSVSGLAAAHYQLGELARLKGDLAGAEESYRLSHHYGRDPQPGYALLRLAQGRPDLAHSSIQAAISAQSHDRLAQAKLRHAEIEIALVRDDLETATRAQAHLEETANIYQSGGLIAAAMTTRGSLLLHQGENADALPTLRSACLCWQELSAPFETARVRLLLARAYRSLGDIDAAIREEEAAATTFTRLGLASQTATPEHPASPIQQRADGLTPREIDILREVAVGKTNREIAAELYISQKTVARHLSNIFVKLELSSRTAAAAYAYEQGLTA